MDKGFYKYIREHGKGYQIIKDNEIYGSYPKLTDALYERDRLVKANWEWEECVQLEETENFYEKMELPKFIREHDYIYEVFDTYIVCVDGELRGKFRTSIDAHEFAEQIGGVVYMTNVRYRIQKSVNGKQKSFGRYKTFEEAKKERDKLIKRGWK